MNKTVPFLVLTFIMFACGNAQDFKVRHIKSDAENFPGIVTAMQVYDSFDEPLTTLKSQNFSASIDGKMADSVSARTYKDAGLGFKIMLCLDISGSMTGTPLGTVKSAVKKFIDGMRSVDKIGIFAIADDAELVSDFSNDKEYLKSKVDGLTSKGNESAIYYTVYKALQKLENNKDADGKIVLLMSDGKNESASASYGEDDVIERAAKSGIPIFSIGYTKTGRAFLRSLERMSEKTGGNFYDAPSDSDLDKNYQKLYRQILHIYLVSYAVDGIAGDGAEHTSAVTVNANNLQRTTSGKFMAPAGVKAAQADAVIISNDQALPVWIYIAAALTLLAAGGGFYFISQEKKKKNAAEKKRLAAEREREQIREAEQRKKAEDEKQKSATPPHEKTPERAPQDRTKMEPQVRRSDKTMVLNSGSSAGTPAQCRLEVLVGVCRGQRFEIQGSGASIGRTQDNDICITEQTVSSHHARISAEGGMYFVEDMGSSNGTFINGVRVTRQKMAHGDTFKFGQCEGTVSIM